MSPIAIVLTALVALLHVGFMVLEMFLWTTPFGRRTFRLTEDKARDTAALAANQGLYNGFLAAGLVWGLLVPDPGVLLFFLGGIVVVGVYGALTVKRSILYVQAVPAIAAAIAVHYF